MDETLKKRCETRVIILKNARRLNHEDFEFKPVIQFFVLRGYAPILHTCPNTVQQILSIPPPITEQKYKMDNNGQTR